MNETADGVDLLERPRSPERPGAGKGPTTNDDLRIISLRHSRPGLVVGVLFFALSLAPSLLPRTSLFQGIVSGITMAIGYGVGSAGAALWRYLEIPPPSPDSRLGRALLWVPVGIVASITVVFVWRQVGWQNDVRGLFGKEPTTPGVWVPILPVTLLVAAALIVLARSIRRLHRLLAGWVERLLPPRVARVVGALTVTVLVLAFADGVLVNGLFSAANRAFSLQDTSTPDGVTRPDSALRSGSPASLVPWETLGRQGRRFVGTGPTVADLDEFSGGGATEPIRVYVGLKSAATLEDRARLLLDELIRTGAFEREALVVVTTTGTGFIEPNAVNPFEYLYNGDTAIAGIQYSFLPSWISLLADQAITQQTSRVVFDTVHAHWSRLPENQRPELYLFGLSLGSFGVEEILTSINMLNAPIDGALMAGPPFVNDLWRRITDERVPGSPASLPIYEDGRTVRFTAQQNALGLPLGRWGDTRVVYLQHASDPVVFFSTELALSRPDWLEPGQRGPDVSDQMTWFPLVTMWQVLFDLPVAGDVPPGYAHLYTSAEYLAAWVGIIEPDRWSDTDLERLEVVLTERERTLEE